MAGGDYRSCDVCERKTFYDADINYDWNAPPEKRVRGRGYALPGLGEWSVICTECAKTHRTQIVPFGAAPPAGEREQVDGNVVRRWITEASVKWNRLTNPEKAQYQGDSDNFLATQLASCISALRSRAPTPWEREP